MMRRRPYLSVLALAALCAACQTISPVEMPNLSTLKASDEDRIAQVLDEVQRGMETRRLYKVLAHVSRNYRDDEGRDYDGITAYLNDFFERYRDIRITRTRPRIQVQGTHAQAFETFGSTAEPVDSGAGIPIALRGQMTVDLEKQGDAWKIVQWGRVR